MSGFEVDPGELYEFAKHVNGLVTDLGETQGKVNDSAPGPLTYGIVGQLFAIGVAVELGNTASSLRKYQDALASLYDSVKKEAENYQFTDEANAKILGRAR